MGLYRDHLLPRIADRALRGEPIEELRRQGTAGLAGEVLEIGFGSGRNVPFYPPEVERVRAVDPATLGRKLAAGRVAASPVSVEYIGLDGEQCRSRTTAWTTCSRRSRCARSPTCSVP